MIAISSFSFCLLSNFPLIQLAFMFCLFPLIEFFFCSFFAGLIGYWKQSQRYTFFCPTDELHSFKLYNCFVFIYFKIVFYFFFKIKCMNCHKHINSMHFCTNFYKNCNILKQSLDHLFKFCNIQLNCEHFCLKKLYFF